jgi:hypothetical protein
MLMPRPSFSQDFFDVFEGKSLASRKSRGCGQCGIGIPLTLPGGKMILLSRSFVRKRVISLATTISVAATSLALAHGPMRVHHATGAAAPIQYVQYVADRPDQSGEAPFLAENDAAMNKMMADMTVKPTGDVDRDFVAMMVPHHQGAVDMAKAVLRYGHNEQLRRLAQEIVVTQQQEIAAMRLAVGEPLPPSVASPTQAGPAPASQLGTGGTTGMSHDSMSQSSMKMQ